MSREFLMAVKESAYKTPKTSPVTWTNAVTYGLANADAYYVRLDGGNAFTMRPRPTIVAVPYGGGVAIDAFAVADKMVCKGKLTTKLYVGQAPFWLSWAMSQVVGGTAPWTTTEPVGDLASVSLYHAIVEEDFTVKRRVYLGCKVDAWQITCSAESTIATLTLDITGSTPQGNQFDSSSDPTSGTFPVPADIDLPTDPYLFIMSNVVGPVIGGATRTKIDEITLNSNNALASKFYNNRFLQVIRFMGRKTTFGAKLAYDHTPDDRTNYEGVTSETASVEFSNGTHSFAIAFNAQNVFNPFEDDLPLPEIYMQSSTSMNMWDPVAGSDFTLTIA